MRVAELMERQVLTVGVDAVLADAIVIMSEARVSALPVVDAHGRMLGVISNTDVLNAEADTELDEMRQLLTVTTVGMLMTHHPLVVAPTATVREAAQQMLYADVHRLYVVEHEKVVGVISTTDIVRAVATSQI
jgi:CBS domain-containing protein